MADSKDKITVETANNGRPRYLDWQVYDWTDKSHPILKGFRKDTPKEIIEEWKADRKAEIEARKKGIMLYR